MGHGSPAYGLGFGAIAVAASAWTLVRHLDVHHLSWLPFASSTGMVAGVALAASLAPAWRVSRFTPMMAIRDDPTGRERIAAAIWFVAESET